MSVSRADLILGLQDIFRDVFLDDSLVISEETSPLEIEEWDSLAHITLVTTVEKAFGVRMSADEIGDINNVQMLIDVIINNSNS